MSKPFVHRQKVLFRHCDPAGIVFYPRYFEMVNDCVEAFFGDVLNYPFEAQSANQTGVPTVQIVATFSAPSRHGDSLEFTLTPVAVSTSSYKFNILVTCGDQKRVSADITLVHVNNDRAAPWPPSVKERLTQLTGEQQ